MANELREMTSTAAERLMGELRRMADDLAHELRQGRMGAELELHRRPAQSVALVGAAGFVIGAAVGALVVTAVRRLRSAGTPPDRDRPVAPVPDQAELDRFASAVTDLLPPPI